MIQSMTGYGKVNLEDEKQKLSIEVRCLNSRQLDLTIKSPGIIRGKEAEVRVLVSKVLGRGKIDLNIYYENLEDPAIPVLNKEAINAYKEQINALSPIIGNVSDDTLISVISRFPDVLKSDPKELDEEEWKSIKESIVIVLDEARNFRKQEGISLGEDMKKRINTVSKFLKSIQIYEDERIIKIQSRLKEKFSELELNNQLDTNRFEQEMIYYLEKLDITEEKVRLENHINYFLETLDADESAGKKLGFIVQEIGREINTIGSKANDADIQKIVVGMKDEMEKIREQLLNVL